MNKYFIIVERFRDFSNFCSPYIFLMILKSFATNGCRHPCFFICKIVFTSFEKKGCLSDSSAIEFGVKAKVRAFFNFDIRKQFLGVPWVCMTFEKAKVFLKTNLVC